MFGFIKKAVKAVGGPLKKVVTSNLTKTVVGGAAFVFPPVGVPAAAALAGATVGLKAVEGGKAAGKAVARGNVKGAVRAAAGAVPGLVAVPPSVVGLAAAAKVVGATTSKDPKKAKQAKAVVARTKAAAKAGDRDAQAGLALMVAAQRFSKWPPGATRMKVPSGRTQFWVHKNGRISLASA